MAPTLTLFLIIFLEGYVVLSTELLAIRLLTPFVGGGTDTVSIIIAAVLMPLAFGYYAGGRFKTRAEGRHKSTVRKRLLRNLMISAIILTPGLSYIALHWMAEVLSEHGIKDRYTLTTLYSLVFLVYPVFLLGQTVPLISNYFSRARLSVMAGKILFFSTLGSFMGAVFCTLILMSFVGVHYSATVTVGFMALLAFILARKTHDWRALTTLACFAAAFYLNSGTMMERSNVVANNKHHIIQIVEKGPLRDMIINHNMSAGMDERTDSSRFEYINYIEWTFIDPLMMGNSEPKDILVVGAGGFTIGMRDTKNNYVYVDIDKGMKDIAEDKFLKQELTPNKKFEAVPARGYLYNTNKKFDLVVLDLYRGPSKTPEHLATKEFFEQVKSVLKHNGIMVGNYVMSPNFADEFSIRMDNTIRAVFPSARSQTVQTYDAWQEGYDGKNIIYSYHHRDDRPTGIYTDDKNTVHFDKPRAY